VNYDLYTEYPCATREDIQRIVGDHKSPHRELESIYTRIMLLAPAIVERTREYAKSGHHKYGGGYKSLIYSDRGPNRYTTDLIRPALKELEKLGLYPPQVDMERLPYLSFFIQIHLILATPCCVGGTEFFYIHECPQLKDMVFKIPVLPSTSWKGNCKKAAWHLVQEGESQKVYDRLFGVGAGEEIEEIGQGRLRFYPTFFDSIGLELINPHSRKTKAGTVPILEEIAIPSARGVFSLLYIPYDLIQTLDEEKAKEEVKEDILFTCKALRNVLHVYGFSAKSSRGFGLARRNYIKYLNGKGSPGGFIEMVGVPVYKNSGEKDNTFSNIDGLDRIVKKIVDELSK